MKRRLFRNGFITSNDSQINVVVWMGEGSNRMVLHGCRSAYLAIGSAKLVIVSSKKRLLPLMACHTNGNCIRQSANPNSEEG
jgi:hypothetical protein